MENATKALIMAAGVLIGVLILSLAIFLFTDFGNTAAEINEQNEIAQLSHFNSRFLAYQGKTLTIYDIITVAGYANENNNKYSGIHQYQINVFINSNDVTNQNRDYLITNFGYAGDNLIQYQIFEIDYNERGRINRIIFK